MVMALTPSAPLMSWTVPCTKERELLRRAMRLIVVVRVEMDVESEVLVLEEVVSDVEEVDRDEVDRVEEVVDELVVVFSVVVMLVVLTVVIFVITLPVMFVLFVLFRMDWKMSRE